MYLILFVVFSRNGLALVLCVLLNCVGYAGVSVKDLSYLMYWVGLVFDLRCLGRSIRRGKDGLKSL